jgi:hypothetical protein
MPHDAKGQILQPGDLVMVPCRVKAVHQMEDFCNLDLETCATMPPEHKYKTSVSAMNTQMVLRANKGDDTSFAVLNAGLGEFRIIAPSDARKYQMKGDGHPEVVA